MLGKTGHPASIAFPELIRKATHLKGKACIVFRMVALNLKVIMDETPPRRRLITFLSINQKIALFLFDPFLSRVKVILVTKLDTKSVGRDGFSQNRDYSRCVSD
ncbi:MAG: hypothetical protein H2045_06170 [Rhizobiales bacterium]|nr:hypothetical protein [Hyphomicrobiales bacterium]